MSNYSPALLGAQCSVCPLYNSQKFKPIQSVVRDANVANIILELPSGGDIHTELPMSGPSEQKVLNILDSHGLSPKKCNQIYAVACYVPRGKGDSSLVQKAAKCCRPRLEQELAPVKSLPTLYMGIDTTHGLKDWEKAQSNYIIQDNRLYTHSAFIALYSSAKFAPIFKDALKRFAELAIGKYKPLVCTQHIGVSNESLRALLKMRHKKYLSYDIETQGTDPAVDPITAAGISDGENTVVLPWDTYQNKTHGHVDGIHVYGKLGALCKKLYIRFITHPKYTRIGHNVMYDAGGFRGRGIPAGAEYDLMAAYYNYHPELPANLQAVCAHLLPIEFAWKTVYKNGTKGKRSLTYEPYMDCPWDTLAYYCGRDVFYTYHAALRLITEPNNYPAADSLRQNTQRNLEIAWRSKLWSWRVDSRRVARLQKTLTGKIADLDSKLALILPAGIKVGSSQQLRHWFYVVQGETITYRTDSGEGSTKALALKYFKKHADNKLSREVAVLLLERAKYRNLLTTLKQFQGLDKVTPFIQPNRQLSGRWSFSDPPMSNLNGVVRKCFVARPGNWLVCCDWSAAEQRMIALVAGDEKMMASIERGEDPHINTAVDSMGLKKEEVTDALRKAAKIVGFNTNYSSLHPESTAKTLLEKFHGAEIYTVSYATILGMLRRLWKTRKEIWDFKVDSYKFALQHKYVEEHIFGRRRFFHAEPRDTECANLRIQGAISSMADIAIQGIDTELDHSKEGILLLHHDSIMVEGPDLLRLINLLKKHMVMDIQYNGRTLRFDVDVQYGRRWYAFKKWRD